MLSDHVPHNVLYDAFFFSWYLLKQLTLQLWTDEFPGEILIILLTSSSEQAGGGWGGVVQPPYETQE